MDRLAQMIERAGGTMMAHQLVLLSLLLGLAGALLGAVLLKTPYGALVGAPIAAAVPFLKLSH